MKIRKSYLKKIIKEEMARVLSERMGDVEGRGASRTVRGKYGERIPSPKVGRGAPPSPHVRTVRQIAQQQQDDDALMGSPFSEMERWLGIWLKSGKHGLENAWRAFSGLPIAAEFNKEDFEEVYYDMIERQTDTFMEARLRRMIKEEKAKILLEGNHVINYMHGYEDARDDLPQNSDDPWYSAGYADYLEGVHDQYEVAQQDMRQDPLYRG